MLPVDRERLNNLDAREALCLELKLDGLTSWLGTLPFLFGRRLDLILLEFGARDARRNALFTEALGASDFRLGLRVGPPRIRSLKVELPHFSEF